MGYTNVFGGELLFPSQTSYLLITTAVDATLVWPLEQQIEGNNVVADFLDIDATVGGLNIDMPDSRRASTGNKTTINNIGSQDFTMRDATGGVIQFVGQGEQWVLVLTDNSTEAGIWSAFQLGAATTLASASALAGAGLQAGGGGLLEQIIDSDEEAATPFNIVDGDRAKCLIYTAGAGTANLPSAGTVFNNWFCMLRNSGSGTLNVVPPAGNIDGGASLNLDPNDSAFFFTDGVDWYTIGLSSGSTIAFDFVSLAVPGSGDFILSGANLDRISYRFTGALTGNRRIIVPNTTQQYWADNQTSGAFTLEVVTAAGVGITVPQGQSVITYCDGTDVINATSSTSVAFPITIGQGGTGATTVGGAQINLQVPPDSRLIDTGAGLSGGGDLTGDRTLLLDINSANTTPVMAAGDFLAFEDIDDNLTYKATIQEIIDLAGITVEDEGVPLATLASTLDFVGDGVVASGAAGTKTITITTAIPLVLLDNEQIRFGTGNDVQMEFDGTNFLISGGEDIFIYENAGVTHQLALMNFSGGVAIEIETGTGDMYINDVVQGTGAFVRSYIKGFASDGEVWIHFGGVGVLRTAPVSGAAYPYEGTSGGALLNNNTTGTGSNERITTYTDHMMTGGLQDDRNLTTTMANDNRLFSGRPCRQGYWKFEIFAYFRDVGGTSNVEFDFDGDANISECNYAYDYGTEDGVPSGSGYGDDKTTDQLINLGSASEETMVRITGRFRMSATGTFRFRWAPTVSQLDTVSRMRGSWMTVCPIEIGV
jgi:hypothetical protein